MILKKGDSSDLVADWQKFLFNNGFIKIKPTGFFGDATERGTKDFQLKYKLVPDGIVGKETRKVADSISNDSVGDSDEIIGEIDGVKMIASKNGSEIRFVAKAAIDADGAYRAYHPKGIGLDYLQNARSSTNGAFVGVLTDSKGNPIVQGKNDPAPGYYISTTSYQHEKYKVTDPRRYLDSETVPYVVIPKQFAKVKGILGALCEVTNVKNGKSVLAIVGDYGPSAKIGEMSMACAAALGLGTNPKKGGGTSEKIIQYVVKLNVTLPGYEIKN